MDGLWTMIYNTEELGELMGGGVMVVDRSHNVLGGDSGMFWTGKIERVEGGVLGTLYAEIYRPDYVPIFHGLTDKSFTIKFKGGYMPDKFNAGAWVEGRPELKCAVRLRKVADI